MFTTNTREVSQNAFKHFTPSLSKKYYFSIFLTPNGAPVALLMVVFARKLRYCLPLKSFKGKLHTPKYNIYTETGKVTGKVEFKDDLQEVQQ